MDRVTTSVATSVAIIADVHGNIWALDAVLNDIAARGITEIINLGDCLYSLLDPVATADRLNQPHITTIAGNMDRILSDPSDAVAQIPTVQYIRSRINAQQLVWIENLPDTLVIGDIFCCHGTPSSNETELLENITPNGVFLADEASIMEAVRGIEQSVILCAHTHVARTVWLSDGRLVVNPGSVGLPAYDHEKPYPHKMEMGSPHARYAVLKRLSAGWLVEQIAIPYDWELAAQTAARNGRKDYEHWLRTGRGGWIG